LAAAGAGCTVLSTALLHKLPSMVWVDDYLVRVLEEEAV
jgi:hypothetical protein